MRSVVVAFVVYAAVGGSLNALTDIGELNAGLIGGAAALLAGYAARRRPSEREAARKTHEDKRATREAAKLGRARAAAIRNDLGHDGASWQSASLPHAPNRPSFADFHKELAVETSYARSNVYVVGGVAENVYEVSMQQRGFDLWEFEDYVDLVCSRLIDLQEQDPGYVDGQVGEWVELVRQTAARNRLTVSRAFQEKWGRRPPSRSIPDRRDTFELAQLRYLDSERADPDGDDLWQNLVSLLPFAVGIGEGEFIPPQVRDDITQLGPSGVYDRIEEIGFTVGQYGRGLRTPILFTEILGLCWNMRDKAGRDTVADHRNEVLQEMTGQPVDQLRAPGSQFFEACQVGG